MNPDLPRISPFETEQAEINPLQMDMIARLLFERAGFRLANYKEKCVMRRINIRIRATNSPSPEAYCQLLRNDGREIARLYKTLTIHVSHFFRNPSVFDLLRNKIIPELFSLHTENAEEIVIWSVGCSTGEEPFALAIILQEDFARELERIPVRIIGTDINGEILTQAREGLYLPERLEEVSSHLRDRYFTAVDGRFRINENIRNMVQFRQEDIFSEGAGHKCDLILCRNVMIYFERPFQEEMLKMFAECLSSGGFLVLGKSETVVGSARNRFQSVSPLERIYRSAEPQRGVLSGCIT